MVWRALTLMALMTSAVEGFNVYVLNRCNVDIDLVHVMTPAIQTETLGIGKTLVRTVPAGSPSHVLKAGAGAQATLAEFSGEGGSWFDISIIPTGPKSGPDYCGSLQACKDYTGGVGYNFPMQIVPRTPGPDRCTTVTCMADGCADAYQFPKDDTKTHHCPPNTDFDLTFCPGGTGGLTPAPTPAPTPSPTPSPTPAPTPAPTPSPTPSPPPSNEESGSMDAEDAGFSGNVKVASLESESEVGGEADTLSATVALAPTTATADSDVVAAGGAKSDNGVTTVSTQSAAESSTGAEVYLLSIVGGVGMVAAAAIVVVRKKKKMLDELNVKTPRDRATTMGGFGTLSILVTPNSEITVL